MNLFKKFITFIAGVIEKFNTSITPAKIDSELRNIEENNKHLTELEVIKLKRKYLDKVDKILDEDLKRIEKYY